MLAVAVFALIAAVAPAQEELEIENQETEVVLYEDGESEEIALNEEGEYSEELLLQEDGESAEDVALVDGEE